jgi:hypothetical protein
MQPRIKFGLIAGVIGLVVNVGVAAALGVCGPLVAALAGAAAGFFTARQEPAATQSDAARAGAVSGAVAGALVLVGQMIGAVIGLALIQASGISPVVGQTPGPNAPVAMTLTYYASGTIAGCCIGAVGIGLAAGAGALVAYLTTAPQAPAAPAGPPNGTNV